MLNDDELKAVTDYAQLFYSVREVAILLEKDPDAIASEFNNKGSFYRAYMRGFYLTEVDIRKRDIELARNGSMPAMDSVRLMIRNAMKQNAE